MHSSAGPDARRGRADRASLDRFAPRRDRIVAAVLEKQGPIWPSDTIPNDNRAALTKKLEQWRNLCCPTALIFNNNSPKCLLVMLWTAPPGTRVPRCGRR